MRFLLLALALVSAPAFAAVGDCRALFNIEASDSIQAARAELLISGLFPVYVDHPIDVPERVRNLGFFEFSNCPNSRAFKGCYSKWITRQGDAVLVAFPTDAAPFIADCPSSMREK